MPLRPSVVDLISITLPNVTNYTNILDKKKSQRLCKIEHSAVDYSSSNSILWPTMYVKKLSWFWCNFESCPALSFSVINLFLFSRKFSAFTTIGISSFYCKTITQFTASSWLVIQNTTLSVGRGKHYYLNSTWKYCLRNEVSKNKMYFHLPWPVFAWLDIMSRVHSHKMPRKTGNILFYVFEQWLQLKLAGKRLMLISRDN